MKLIYEGPHLEVEVPHDEVPGGMLYATRGEVVEVPDAVAESLLTHGENSDPNGPDQRTWRKATAKETQAADKAAAKTADAVTQEGGDAS